MVGDTGLEQPAPGGQEPRFAGSAAQNPAQSGPVSPDVLDLAARLMALPVEARQALAAVLGKV